MDGRLHAARIKIHEVAIFAEQGMKSSLGRLLLGPSDRLLQQRFVRPNLCITISAIAHGLNQTRHFPFRNGFDGMARDLVRSQP
jgi:hypothetical protein